MDVEDGEINDGCGNFDRILLKIYTTSCHDKIYRHGYICQYEGKYNIWQDLKVSSVRYTSKL